MAAAGTATPLRARVNLTTEIRPSWLGQNVRATLPGKTDEWVFVIAHLDGYFDAANDNGAGTASLLALARYFAQDAEQPNRNMMFVGTSGHHEFSDGADAFIEIPPGMINGNKIALEELNQKKVPFIIRRPIPNGGTEYWRLEDLELLSSY